MRNVADDAVQKAQEQIIEEKVARLKERPIVLASTSKYRAEGLRQIGFKNVYTFGDIPDNLETNLQNELGTENFDSWDDPRQAGMPERIAEAKVREALTLLKPEETSVATVCAFDTMPSFARSKFDPSVPLDHKVHTAGKIFAWEHLVKPKSIEEAKEKMKEVFKTLRRDYAIAQGAPTREDVVNQYVDVMAYRSEKEGWNNESERIKIENQARRFHFYSMLLVNTGFAVKFPDSDTIHSGSSRVYLELGAVLESKDDAELDVLIDQIVEVMETKDIGVLKIGGGINYVNPEVRALLKIREVPQLDTDIVEQGVYLGMPQTEFDQFLRKIV